MPRCTSWACSSSVHSLVLMTFYFSSTSLFGWIHPFTTPSVSNFKSLFIRCWMMEASVTHSHISLCSRRIWTPCLSVGPLTLMVLWWWAYAGLQRWVAWIPWLSPPTTVKLTFDLLTCLTFDHIDSDSANMILILVLYTPLLSCCY